MVAIWDEDNNRDQDNKQQYGREEVCNSCHWKNRVNDSFC
jgi:hypothetical protein